MSVFQIFLLKEELDSIVRNFATKHGLAGVVQTWDELLPYAPEQVPSAFMVNEDVLKIYLFPAEADPALHLSVVSPKAEHWIDIYAGRTFEQQRRLTMSTIQAVDVGKGYRPASWLRRFFQQRPDIHFGVMGENVVYGGSGFYRNVGYSAQALDLFHQRMIWCQSLDDNVVFRPGQD